MKQSFAAFFVGLLTMATLAFNSPKKATLAPVNNLYLVSLVESQTYKNTLQNSVSQFCRATQNNFQSSTSVEAIHKMKFVKGVMSSTNSPEFKAVLAWLTNINNHSDINNPDGGFNNCANQLDADFNFIVKSFYGIDY
jgi:hypothetical protein